MFSIGYLWNELRRRWSRTLVTAVGLAAGVGLVMAIIGVSAGLTDAQGKALSPLSTVGTDIIVTRTVGATTAAAASTTTTTTAPTGFGGPGAGGGPGGGGGGGFFGGGARGLGGTSAISSLNSTDQATLLNANSSILTDLSKLGPAGTAFTYDFFVPGTLITFPDQALQVVSAVKGVQSAVPGLSLQALHESGTVPAISASIQTGGQTITATSTPAPLTAAERTQVRQCLQNSGAFPNSTTTTTPAGSGPPTATPGASGNPTRGGGFGGGGGGALDIGALDSRFGSAFTTCLPARYQQYEAQVVVPTQTITQVLNPPQTDTQTKSYTVAGVNPSNTTTGLITKAQLVSGSWFGSSPADQLLVNTAYASSNSIKVGQTLTIDSTTFTVVGLVNPTLTGNTSDLYFDLATLQSLASNAGRVNEVLVKVTDASQVDAVAAAIQKELPGAQVLTSKSLASQVTGSLSQAHSLATNLGGALAVIVLLAAFLIAALLTLASVAKRVREIGTLRALGWSKGRVVRQIVAETVGIGLLGGVIGIGLGVGICALITHLGPTLTSTSTGTAVGASTAGSVFHQATTAAASTSVRLTAPIKLSTVGLGLLFGGLGGFLSGGAGGWRAARLPPASAMRDLG